MHDSFFEKSLLFFKHMGYSIDPTIDPEGLTPLSVVDQNLLHGIVNYVISTQGFTSFSDQTLDLNNFAEVETLKSELLIDYFGIEDDPTLTPDIQAIQYYHPDEIPNWPHAVVYYLMAIQFSMQHLFTDTEVTGNLKVEDPALVQKLRKELRKAVTLVDEYGAPELTEMLSKISDAPSEFYAHEVLTASPEKIAKRIKAKDLERVGWRFLYETIQKEVYAVDMILNEKTKGYEFSEINYDLFNTECWRFLAHLKPKQRRRYSLIRLPGIHVNAIWVKPKKGKESVIPIGYEFGRLKNDVPLSKKKFFKKIIRLAKEVMASPTLM